MQTIKRALKKLIASNRYQLSSIIAKIEDYHRKGLLTDDEYNEIIAEAQEQ